MTIELKSAAKFYKNLIHQNEAWEYLQKSIPTSVLNEFANKYRNQTPRVSQSGIELIKKFEGFESKAYPDPLSGNLPITIGYGSTKNLDGQPFKLGETITQQQAEELLINQILKDFIPSLQKIPYWDSMNSDMQGALLSFGYNLGADFYNSSGFNTITKTLKEKRWKDVPSALNLYVNPGTNVTVGLMRRRKAEGELWISGLNRLA